MPDSVCIMPEGRVLIANGMQPMLRWDGLSATCEAAGVLPPATACSIAGSGLGGIIGTYQAYVRFVDRFNNYSDLSPISASANIQSASQTITAASSGAPIQITSANHGLTTGATVKVSGVGGVEAANNTWEITVVDPSNFTLNGSDGFAETYTSGGTWASGVSQVTYSSVPLPQESKVVRRQILRNTDGQLTTFYVDVDTQDLASGSLVGTNTDSILSAQQAVPLLDTNGLPFANSHGVPPAHKKTVAQVLDRVFAAAEVNYTEGNVSVTFGSTVVQGIGTEWTESFPTRFLYVNGAQNSYDILSVDTTKQQLTLTAPYLDATAPYARYAIRPAPAEGRLVYYSEAGESESWPVINAISVDADGDEITGLMVIGSFLYITERRHIYRFTFQDNPASDGRVFLATSSRGVVNHRCWVSVEDMIYCLDEQGIHAFDGGDGSEPISEGIQDIFRFAQSPYEINWSASDFFHAVHYPPQETVRWFVCLSGHYLPRHALCFNYRLKRWWIEEFYHPIGASTRGTKDGRSVVYLGADAGRVLAYWTNTLDGADAAQGTVRGTVTSATLITLTDTKATFATSGLVGCPVAIVDGTGVDQVRRITKIVGQTVYVDRPWLKLPDTTSVYQIGGISWLWRSGWFRYVVSEEEIERRLELVWEPLANPALARLRLYQDSSGGALTWKHAYSALDGNGVRVDQGSTDLVVDLTKASGFAQKRLDSRRETYLDGPRFMTIDMRGATNQDEIALDQLTLDGVIQ